MIKNRVGKKKNQNGFTMIELLYSLLITGTIAIIGYKSFMHVNTKNRLNADVDSISANENIAVRFVMDQNKTIINKMKSNTPQQLDYYAFPFSQLNSFNSGYFVQYSNKFAPSAFSDPCLIITRDSSNEVLKAYLFWNNISKPNNSMYNLMNLKYIIEHKFATELVNANSSSLNIITNPENNNSPTILKAIQNTQSPQFQGCGYTVSNNSILLDLSKNKDFQMVRDLTTDNSGNLDISKTSEALTNNGDGSNKDSNQTLTTNLYLDAIVKESEPWEKDICQPTESLNITEADQNCRNLGTMYKQYDGQPSWGADFWDIGNNMCKYQPTGLFKGVSYTCDVNFLNGKINPSNSCLANSANVGGTGSTSVWYSGAKYLSWGWSSVDKRDPNCRGQYNCSYNNRICDVSLQNMKNAVCSLSGKYGCNCTGGLLDDGNFRASYNPSTDKCDLSYTGGYYCKDGRNTFNGVRETVGTSPQFNQVNLSYWTGYYTADKVYGVSQRENCTAVNKPKVHLSGITPPKHKYQSLKFGTAELKTTNPDGTDVVNNPAINIGNSGVKTGFVFIRSQNLNADSPCTKEELGKIYQQSGITNNYTGSQLVCNYDPNFCGGDGYCYSPLVSDSVIVKGPSRDLNCPAGTIISKNYSILNYSNNSIINQDCISYKSTGAKFFGV